MSEHIIRAVDIEEEEPAYQQLLENHHLETYDDYAGILRKMREAVLEMLHDEQPRDAIEKQNLNTLADLLPVCSDLFRNCDEYYRRYRH